ncbi:MAG: hypothetical protein DRJ06_01445 [Candidatus Aminicenantes bacterium]|nr:MAG: hypothetical protein DRJ06_01445 [Candidatus Aminicenantes bacterium]
MLFRFFIHPVSLIQTKGYGPGYQGFGEVSKLKHHRRFLNDLTGLPEAKALSSYFSYKVIRNF